MLPTITIDGRLVGDPELRFTNSGKAVCSMRVAASDSKKDDAGNWQTTDQIFINVSLWEQQGEEAAEHLQKGDRVLIAGRIYQREYENREGEKRTSLEVKFPTVAKVPTTSRRQQPAPSTGTDPWAVPNTDDAPPF